MGKARRQKNTQTYVHQIDYINENTDDIWGLIENESNLFRSLSYYNNTSEDKFEKSVENDELTYYIGVPYDNYAVTSKGKVWSFKTKKFIKIFYRPNSCICYLNSTANVKVKELFRMAGWKYSHAKVCEYLLSQHLLIDDYNRGDAKINLSVNE